MELLTGLLFVFCMASLGSIACQQSDNGVLNVLNYGAVGDGITDDSKAFLEAWTAACGAMLAASTLRIPEQKTFLLNPVTFQGPCKSSTINVQVYGKIVAPNKRVWPSQKLNNWLVFSNVNRLIVNGTGQIDGQGSAWWDELLRLDNAQQTKNPRPTALEFFKCDNLQLSGLTHINSPRSHVTVSGSTNIAISDLYITAPKDSPNTDGINIGRSSNVQIHDCVIKSGDDCIAIAGGSANVNITGITCGPGHGISIGSLGAGGATETVEEVRVRNCSLNGTKYGARIKTWQGGSGYARNISFEDITLIEAGYPILIDQYYCITGRPCANQTKAVQVSDVTYKRFNGTTITSNAIKLACSESVACTDIVLSNINMTSAIQNKALFSSCLNARGKSTATDPIVNCLLP